MAVRHLGLCLGLAVVLALPPEAVGAQPPAHDFWVHPESRVVDEAALDDPTKVGQALERLASVTAVVHVEQEQWCAPGARWRRDRVLFAPTFERTPGVRGCQFRLVLPADEATRLETRNGAQRAAHVVNRPDRLVVALGDAIAAGEGNPDAGGGWRSLRCHRSATAGVTQAARLLAQVDPGKSITFVNLACSGATMRRGVLGRYAGIVPGKHAIPSQRDRLGRIVALRERPVDAVLLSAGGADLGVAAFVARCSSQIHCERSSSPAAEKALARLAPRYDAVAAGLEGLVDPRAVFVTEYPDPTRGREGETCGTILGRVTTPELDWMQRALLRPLDETIAEAVDRHGWRPVGGIADAFATHGACLAPIERWVRLPGEPGLNAAPTSLPPNPSGQLAIANAILAPLGQKVGVVPRPQDRAEVEEHGNPVWLLVAMFVLVVLSAILIESPAGSVRSWPKRFAYLFRPGHEPTREPINAPRLQPVLSSRTGSGPIPELLVKTAGVLGSAALSVGFVVVVGATIVWVRFSAARYPADQAVDAVGREELLVIGAQALVLFAVIGAVAVVLMWFVDGQGTSGRRTRIALAILFFFELLAALLVGDYGLRQFEQLALGFAVAAALALFLFEVVRRVAKGLRELPPGTAARYVAGRYVTPRQTTGDQREPLPGFLLQRAWQLVPFGFLVAAVVVALTNDFVFDRYLFAFVPILIAALFFVAPGMVAAGATWRRSPLLRPARAALAATTLTVLAIFLLRDEAWLAGAVVTAVILGGLCLTVASASGQRFLPFAITVFFAVCVYGAMVTCLRILDSPQAQPVAMLLEDKRAVCGVWVGESSGRVFYARLQLDENAAGRRPAPRRSLLASVARDDVVDMAVGPLQTVGRAQDQAVAMRKALQAEHDWDPENVATSCGPPRPQLKAIPQTRERALAKALQPELIVDRKDGFWPVSVQTLFAMQDRRARVCRRVSDDACVRLISQADLPFNGGEGEWLDYPADVLRRDDQERLFRDALGTDDPARTARVYYLVTRGPGPNAPSTVQFWFFYTYSYLDVGIGPFKQPAGLHEGDFETISIMVSARSHTPRYVWMARHKDEGRMFLWEDDTLRTEGRHATIYAARGSHADYENCRRQSRIQAPAGLIDDRPQCDPNQELHLAPESTRLIDVSRAGWACWRGRFGTHPGASVAERVPYESDDGPRGPLWQQKFGDQTFTPCRGVRASIDRDVPDEEVLSPSVSKRLREGAGRLDPAVDECDDWEHATTSGALIVACEPTRLRRYIDSGLENAGSEGVRIDVVDGGATRPGPITVPALRRDPRVKVLTPWRVVATRDTVADVFASCQVGKGLVEIRFRGVRLDAERALHVDDRAHTVWRLRDEAGRQVGRDAKPHVVKPVGDGVALSCGAARPGRTTRSVARVRFR